LSSLTLALVLAGGWLVITRGGLRRLALPLLGLAIAGIILLAWAGAGVALGRFSTAGSELGTRLAAWHDAVRIISQFPLMGTGLNTYGSATLLYQTTSRSTHFQEAHNEYLQIAAEGGLFLIIAVAFCVWRLMRMARSRFTSGDEPTLARWTRIGAATALIAIAFQSLMEFSLQMPGNAALFAVVAAIAIHAGGAEPERRASHGHRTMTSRRSEGAGSRRSTRTTDDARN